ncbi:MAG: hypothetical protein IJU58_00530 [Clostridia bacterium]|nr:hypothetical protein [Clostridia bacterium]
MEASKFVAIYYISDTLNYNSNLKSFFQKHGIELSYETNFCKLLSKILVTHPMMLVVSSISKDFLQQFLELFDIESPYFVPCICILEDEYDKNIPYNFVMCGKSGYEDILANKIEQCMVYKHSLQNVSNFPMTRFDIITKVLRGFGVNVKSSGSIFLKDCINQVIIDGCKACTLYSNVYTIVATMHGTTVNNLERCMRTAIGSAWELYNSQNNEFARKLNNGALFGCRPTVKEFIYYVANYVRDLECESKIQWLVNGTAKSII